MPIIGMLPLDWANNESSMSGAQPVAAPYWGAGDYLDCSWEHAHDEESGIFAYEVLVIEVREV